MTTATEVPEGTRKLAEWACSHFWPCPMCGATRIEYHVGEDCRYCTSDPWLRAALDNPTDDEWWGVFGDFLEGEGDPRAADCRMIARLLPLDVWPDTSLFRNTGREIAGWWWEARDTPSADCSRLGFVDQINPKIYGTADSILSALRSLDRALQERANQQETGT